MPQLELFLLDTVERAIPRFKIERHKSRRFFCFMDGKRLLYFYIFRVNQLLAKLKTFIALSKSHFYSLRSMEFRTFLNQHSGRLPDGTKILFFDNFVEFKLISREKVSDHFVKYWICDRVNQLFSFYICWQCWRTVANSVFTIFQVISGWDQFERRTRTGTTTPTLGESRKTHIYILYMLAF